MLIKKNKIIILFLFLLLFCFSLISNSKTASAIEFIPQVTIPGSDFQAGVSTTIENSTVTIGEYIKSFYNYLIAIVGLVAAIVLMLAGVIWLTAAGNTSKISQAKGLMMGSFTGIVLVLTSYIILKTINPGLVEFRDVGMTKIDPIKEITLCVRYNEGERKGELKEGKAFILRTQSDLEENKKIIESGGEIKNIATQCKDDETCLKIKYENPNDIFECIKKNNIKCCQYEKDGTFGITCRTITNGSSCPNPHENYNDIKLKYIYKEIPCDYSFNDSGRNSCVPGGKQ